MSYAYYDEAYAQEESLSKVFGLARYRNCEGYAACQNPKYSFHGKHLDYFTLGGCKMGYFLAENKIQGKILKLANLRPLESD
jgi:hypothetical protein